jgi:hypothetical protein
MPSWEMDLAEYGQIDPIHRKETRKSSIVIGVGFDMAVRKKLIDRVAEQIAEMTTEQFIVLDVTSALVSCSGKPLATNAEVSSIMRCYGLARNTGAIVKRGDATFTVWERSPDHARVRGGKKGGDGNGVNA